MLGRSLEADEVQLGFNIELLTGELVQGTGDLMKGGAERKLQSVRPGVCRAAAGT